jgi:Na+-translocating ferredoxin:NAD+ oxidoreductase RnfD subunit
MAGHDGTQGLALSQPHTKKIPLYIILPAFVGSVIACLDRVFSWRVPVSFLLAGGSRAFDAHPEREPGEPVNLLFSR